MSSNGVIQVVAFWIWLHSLTIMLLRLICVVASINNSFLLSLSSVSLFGYITIRWTFGLFPILTIMNQAASCIHIQVFQWTYILISLELVPRSEIAGLYGTCVFIFIGHSQTLYQSWYSPSLFFFPLVELFPHHQPQDHCGKTTNSVRNPSYWIVVKSFCCFIDSSFEYQPQL